MLKHGSHSKDRSYHVLQENAFRLPKFFCSATQADTFFNVAVGMEKRAPVTTGY